jgi:hypothetical protein
MFNLRKKYNKNILKEFQNQKQSKLKKNHLYKKGRDGNPSTKSIVT